MEIVTTNAILHILDTNAALPIFSQQELDLSEEAIRNFIDVHSEKLFHDRAAREGVFTDQSAISDILMNRDTSFVESSIEIANCLYGIMKKNIDIPSSDLLIAAVEIDKVPYLSIIKLNYREGYTHYVDSSETGINNKIIVQKAIFASVSQKIDEGALINLDDLSIKVLEKEYPINGEKRYYFTELFLGCNTDLSQKESLKVINTVAKQMAKKYYNDDFEKNVMVKSVIYDNLEDQGVIDVDMVAETVFRDNHEIKKEYMEKVKEAGVNKTIALAGENPEKSFSKYKIKTDNGIVINIPIEVYGNKDVIDFVNNPNGTVSIIIKQVNKLTSN